jgi:4-amino-4-deoxy-L-arabinose transferase-like glycosyltransferase
VTAIMTEPPFAHGGHGQPRGRITRLLRGPEDTAWARPALLALLAATAVLYLVGLSRDGWANAFYAGAVQAGTKSWKAFFFGSFDAANFITVDKPPASLWVMEISARIFGLNSWSLLVPQALEGVATVGVLYATVRRWFGPAAGLIAGAVLAVTPVATLMFRYDNPDALLVLLLMLAAYAITRALESGRTRWLALTGALLGFGFLTKMLQAFLVLPVFALVYLIAGPPRLGRRIWQLLVGGAAVVVAAGWWVGIVMLTPAADRPYVAGSTDNNILQLTFGYNGLGRLTGNETGSVGPTTRSSAAFGGPAGLTRLFSSTMGSQASWLIPAAVIGLMVLLWLTRRSPRTDRTRAAALVWGGWLVLTGLVFSFMSGIIHPYYTIALAPAIGALTGIAAVTLWRIRERMAARLTLTAMLAVTAAWAWVLLGRSPGWYPWLRVVVVVLAALGAAGFIMSGGAGGGRRARERGFAGLTLVGQGRRFLTAAAVSLAVIAGLAGPLAYSSSTAATAYTGAIPVAGPAAAGGLGGPGAFRGAGGAGQGGFPRSGEGRFPGGGVAGRGGVAGGAAAGAGGATAGASGAGAASAGGQPGADRFPGGAGGAGGRGFAGGGGLLGRNTQVNSALTKLLQNGAAGYTWAAATVGAESAAPFQLASGDPIMAIGGFNGTDPAPTLAQFEKLVSEHEIHYFVGQNQASFGGGTGDAAQITAWVKKHFTSQTIAGVTVYNLTSPISS